MYTQSCLLVIATAASLSPCHLFLLSSTLPFSSLPLFHPSFPLSLPPSFPYFVPPSPPFHTDASVSQVAIAWLLYQPSVVSVVIGARTVEQLEDNLQSVNLQLSKEEVSPQSLPHNTFILSTVESLGISILPLIASTVESLGISILSF